MLVFKARIQKMLVRIASSADPDQTASEDQTASSEAVWSRSALLVKTFLGRQLVSENLEYLPYLESHINNYLFVFVCL